jgi:hypothetical protein
MLLQWKKRMDQVTEVLYNFNITLIHVIYLHFYL